MHISKVGPNSKLGYGRLGTNLLLASLQRFLLYLLCARAFMRGLCAFYPLSTLSSFHRPSKEEEKSTRLSHTHTQESKRRRKGRTLRLLPNWGGRKFETGMLLLLLLWKSYAIVFVVCLGNNVLSVVVVVVVVVVADVTFLHTSAGFSRAHFWHWKSAGRRRARHSRFLTVVVVLPVHIRFLGSCEGT